MYRFQVLIPSKHPPFFMVHLTQHPLLLQEQKFTQCTFNIAYLSWNLTDNFFLASSIFFLQCLLLAQVFFQKSEIHDELLVTQASMHKHLSICRL
jgi:hypothetical protein